MLKNPPSTNVDEKFADCSISMGCSTSFTFVVFFSTCYYSLESLIRTNVNVGGEKCLRRHYNVSSSPPIVVAHFNV